MAQYIESIEQHFHKYPVANVAEGSEKIEESTGIQRCKTHVRVFLKKLGMRYRKVGSVIAGPDPDEQEQFKDVLMPRIEQAKVGKRYLLPKYEIRRWGTITTSGYFTLNLRGWREFC